MYAPAKNRTQITTSAHSNINQSKNTSNTSNIRPRFITLIFAFSSIVITWIVYHCYEKDQRESGSWGCEMSWMSPSYYHLDWQDNPFPRYQVFLYQEQGIETDFSIAGHPVLFIPGNAGSYQQVRSIASSAFKQYSEGISTSHAGHVTGYRKLDFFTIDFNEDFSAFQSRTLSEQAAFIRHAVSRVLDEYRSLPLAERPSQVTLLAHSMGGIAARSAVTREDIAEHVDAILTLSTPHTVPPLTMEYSMSDIYRRISVPIRPLLISLCGGVSDTQVVSDSCALPPTVVTELDGFSTFTTGISGAWTGVDHQAIVWCHQIRSLVAQALLGMAQHDQRVRKLAIAQQSFLQPVITSSSGPSQNVQITSVNMTILAKPISSESKISFTVEHCLDHCREIPFRYEQLPLPQDPLSPFPLPGEGIKVEETLLAVDIYLKDIQGFLVVRSDTHRVMGSGSMQVDKIKESSWTRLMTNYTSLELHFSNVHTSSLLVHRLHTSVNQCSSFRPIIKHVSQPMPPLEDTTTEARFYPDDNRDIYLHSHIASAPFQNRQHIRDRMTVRIFQQDGCPIEAVRLSLHLPGTLAKIVTRYRMTLLSWPFGWAALILAKQLQIFLKNGQIPSFGISIEEVGWKWFPGCCSILVAGNLIQISLRSLVNLDDLLLGTTEIAFVPLVLFMSTWTFGLTCTAWLVIDAAITCTRMLLSRMRMTHVGTSPPPTSRLIVQFLVPLVLVYLIVPHQLAFIIFFAAMWTSLVWSDHSHASHEFGAAAFFFMLWLVPFKATGLVVWARSLWINWNHPMSADHNLLYVGPVISLVGLYSLGAEPKRRERTIQGCCCTLILLVIAVFLFGSRYTWILPPIGHTVLVFLAAILW